MMTSVQLHEPARGLPRCELVYGRPREIVSGRDGPIALFPSGEIVAYLLRCQWRRHLYVLRTLDVDDRFAASVCGVRPRVRLLLHLRSRAQIRRARGLFAYLAKHGPDPSELADAFYLRVSGPLGRRLVRQRLLLSLVSPQPSPIEP
jgi:hypothetical protein